MSEEVIIEQRIVKGGIDWIQLAISRGKFGMEVWVKAVPEVENLMKGLGNGETDLIDLYGRDWYPINQEKSLKIYNQNDSSSLKGYRMGDISQPLYPDSRNGRVNLSFLRIAGISEAGGITFGVRGAISRKEVRNLKEELTPVLRQLILDYLVPISVSVQVSSQEV